MEEPRHQISIMHGRASYSPSDFEYPRSDFGQSHPKSFSQPTLQYGQYAGSGSQQPPITPENVFGSQDWAASYAISGQALNLGAFQMNALHSSMDSDLILPSRPNPDEVKDVDVNAFTTSAFQEWRPPGFSENDLISSGFQTQPRSRHYGALPELDPNISPIIELGSDESSNHESALVIEAQTTIGTDVSVDDSNLIDELRSGAASTYMVHDYNRPGKRPRGTKHASDSQVQQTSERRGRRGTVPQQPCSVCGTFMPKNASDAT